MESAAIAGDTVSARTERDYEYNGPDRRHLQADYFNLLTGYASLETLYRSLYYTKSLSRTYDCPFNYVTTTNIRRIRGRIHQCWQVQG